MNPLSPFPDQPTILGIPATSPIHSQGEPNATTTVTNSDIPSDIHSDALSDASRSRKSRAYSNILRPQQLVVFVSDGFVRAIWLSALFKDPFVPKTDRQGEIEKRLKKAWNKQSKEMAVEPPATFDSTLRTQVTPSPLPAGVD